MAKTRSEYLEVLLANSKRNVRLANANSLGVDYATVELDTNIDTIQKNNTSTINTANQMIGKDSNNDRSWYQKYVDLSSSLAWDFTYGLFSFADDIFDLAVNVSGEVGSWFGASKEWTKDVTDFDWQTYATQGTRIFDDVLSGDMFADDYWSNWSSAEKLQQQQAIRSQAWTDIIGEKGQQFVSGLAQNVGRMIPSILMGNYVGAGASLLTTGIGAFAGQTNEAYRQSGNLGKSALAGLGSALVEVASEAVVGKALGAVGLGTGKIAGLFKTGKAPAKTTSFIKDLAKTMFEEGVEEAFAGVMQPVVNSLYQGKEAFKNENGENIYFDKDFWFGNNESVANQALSGAVLGGLLGGVSLTQQYKALKKEGVQVEHLLEKNHTLYQEQAKYEKTDKRYQEINEEMSANAVEIASLIETIKKDGTPEQIKNVAMLMGAPAQLIAKFNETEEAQTQAFSKTIERRAKQFQNNEQFGTINLFNEMVNNYGADYKLRFSKLKDNVNAQVNHKRKEILINSSLEGDFAPALAHEYIGHVIGDNMDSNTRQKIFDKVVKTKWFEKNSRALRKAYNTTDKDLWQSEVINNYLEGVLTQSTNAKSVKMIDDVFLRNTLLNRFSSMFKKNNNFKILKNNAVLKEFTGGINRLMELLNKNVSRALAHHIMGQELDKEEKKYYEKYKDIFDYMKKMANKEKPQVAFSKRFEESYRGEYEVVRSEIFKKLNDKRNKNKKTNYVYSANNFYIYKKTGVDNFEIVLQLDIEKYSGLIKELVGGLNDGKINGKSNRLSEIIALFRSRNGIDNWNSSNDGRGQEINSTGKMDRRESSSSQSESSREGVRNLSDRGKIKYSKRLDSQGNNLTIEQANYFSDSKVRDENGNLLVVYHGTNNDFNVFEHSRIGETNGRSYGYGFYFIADKEIANSYGDSKEYYIDIRNPISNNKKTLGYYQIKKLLRALDSKGTEGILSDFGDVNYVGYEQVLADATNLLWENNDNDLDIISELSYLYGGSGGAEEFNRILKETLKIDGVITKYNNTDQNVYVAFNSNQIKLVSNTKPTENVDIRYSIRIDGKNYNLETNSEEYIDEFENQLNDIQYVEKMVDGYEETFVNKRYITRVNKMAMELKEYYENMYDPTNFDIEYNELTVEQLEELRDKFENLRGPVEDVVYEIENCDWEDEPYYDDLNYLIEYFDDVDMYMEDHIEEIQNKELEEEAETENETEIAEEIPNKNQYSTVAPYFNTQVDENNFEKVKEKVDKEFKEKANEIANELGLTIKNISTNIGSFEFSEGEVAGQVVQELSYTFELENNNKELCELFSCLMGDLAYEQQEAVIRYNYTTLENENANAVELRLKVKDTSNLKELLLKNGFKDYTINLDTKEIIFLDFAKDTDKFMSSLQKLIDELGENLYGQKTKPIESSYIDREARQVIYRTWLETRSGRGEKFSDNLYESIEKAYEELTAKEVEDTNVTNVENATQDTTLETTPPQETNVNNVEESNASNEENISQETSSQTTRTRASIPVAKPSNSAQPMETPSLEPYENDKGLEIREGAKEKEGNYITISQAKDVLTELENKISDVFGEQLKLKKKGAKARRLFEEYNISASSAKKENCKKFIRDLFNVKVDSGFTYGEFLVEQGFDINNMIEDYTNLMFEILNKTSKESITSQKIKKLEDLLNRFIKANNEHKATVKFLKTLTSLRDKLKAKFSKVGNTGQLDLKSGFKKAFYSFISQFRFTNNDYVSMTNLTKLSEMVENGSFDQFIDSVVHQSSDVNNLGELVNVANVIKEMARELVATRVDGQTHMTYEQTTMFINMTKSIYKLYKEQESGIIEKAKEEAQPIIDRAIEVANRFKHSEARNFILEKVFDALSPREIIAFACGGSDTPEFKKIYEELYRDPYLRQISKQTDFLIERDQHIGTIRKLQNQKITVNGVKIKKYVLYQFYLNTLSPDNVERMKKGGIQYTTKTTQKLDYDSMQKAVEERLSESELEDLNALFELYNGEVKKYVENTSEKLYGFSVSRENYYPIVGSEAFKISDLAGGKQMKYNINAMNNGRLKALTNRKTVIELNINPIMLFNSYIESMTITGEIGIESQKLNRIFQLKGKDGKSLISVMSSYIPNAPELVKSIFSKLIGTVETIERNGMLDKLAGRFATATLGLNIRSMFKQFGSFFTAWSKVGFKVGLKAIVSPRYWQKLNKDHVATHLKENAVFKHRIYENGYVRGMSLSAGAEEFASTFTRKIINLSMKGMEYLDRLTCYSTYTLAQAYIESSTNLEYGTKEYYEAVDQMWTDIILETQSNADRISMSRIRSGEKGWLVKNLFGLFQSDAQNKASLLFGTANDISQLKQDLSKLKQELISAEKSDSITEEEKTKIKNKIKNIENKIANANVRMRGTVSGLVASAMWVLLADMLADWLYDKEEPKDEKFIEILGELLSNSTIDWIPYFNTIYNWITYDGAELSTLEPINNVIDVIKSFGDGEISKQDYVNALINLLKAFGIPAGNVNKLIEGILGNFNPELALKYKSLYYNMSQSYLSKNYNEQTTKGNTKKALGYLSINHTIYKYESDDEVLGEINNLNIKGHNVSIRNIPSSYVAENGQEIEITSQQSQMFKQTYNLANDSVKAVINDPNYQNLTDEEKAKVIKKISDAYYEYALYKSTGQMPTTRLGQLLAKTNGNINFELIALMTVKLNGLVGTSRKEIILRELNKIKGLTRNEKMLVIKMLGFSVAEENKDSLVMFLTKNGLTKTEAEAFV